MNVSFPLPPLVRESLNYQTQVQEKPVLFMGAH